MSYDFVLTEVDGPVGIVTINRPQVRNALNHQTIAELVDALETFDLNEAIRCMVLTGDDRAFAAGADIAQMADAGAVEVLNDDNFAHWTRFRAIHKPVIAAVSGYALGGGCELALMCDLVVASETAQFGQPEVKIGIIPGAGGTQRWARSAGKVRAMEAVLTGEPGGAVDAERIGLGNRVVPSGAPVDGALRPANPNAGRPARAVAGADRKDVAARAQAGESDLGEDLRANYAPMIRAIRACPTPVIAALNGTAAGAGLSLALACDLRIAAAGAQLIVVFVRVGLVPDAGSLFFLTRMLGLSKATELAMTGDPLTAEEGKKLGVISAVVPAEQLMPAAVARANELAAGPRRTYALIKRGIERALGRDLEQVMELESQLQAVAAATPDAQEAIRAFVEKRQPVFRG